MTEKRFTNFGNKDYCLVDRKIFIKVEKVFEMIEKCDDLRELENFLCFDLNYIVATYLEKE